VLTGAASYDVFIRFMPVFGTIALIVWYLVLRRPAGTVAAAVGCLLVATSVPMFQLATRGVMSDLPFFLFSGLAVWSLAGLEQARSRPLSLWLTASTCLLTVMAVLIRSAGVAICAGLIAWAITSAVLHRRRSQRMWRGAIAAALAGFLALASWMAWSKSVNLSEDHGNHMRSYASQLGMKDPHRPDLGAASPGDVIRRLAANLPEQSAAMMSVFLSLPWISPLWYSPIVIAFVLLTLAGCGSWLYADRSTFLVWYFFAYFTLYLLWPFDERVRFLLPICPLGFVFLWEGLHVTGRFIQARPVFAAGCAALAAGAFAGGAVAAGVRGLQGRVSIALWIGVLAISLVVLARRGRTATAAAVFQGFRLRFRSAPEWIIVALLTVGFLQQILLARGNLAPQPSSFVHYPAAQSASWLRAAPEGVVMAQQLEIIHRLTGRKVQQFLVTSDPKAIVEAAKDQHVRYLVVSRPVKDEYFAPSEEQRYALIDRAFPGLLQLVHEGAGYRIFQFRTAGAVDDLENTPVSGLGTK
jgi:hypothetical protein